jgi:hypothetical protein
LFFVEDWRRVEVDEAWLQFSLIRYTKASERNMKSPQKDMHGWKYGEFGQQRLVSDDPFVHLGNKLLVLVVVGSRDLVPVPDAV